MSIAQRKDGRYCVKYKYDGKWQQRTFRTEKEAIAFDSEQHIEAAAEEDLSVGEIMVSYIRNVPHHWKSVSHMKSCFFKPSGEGYFLFDRYPQSLTRRDLERLRESFRAKGCKNRTINNRVSMVRAALNWAVEQEFIDTNPWQKYKRLPVKQEPISVSMSSFKAIYAHAPEWLQWAMKTAFCLCLRPGHAELFGLKWSSFNFATGSVTINQGKSGILKTVLPPSKYMEEARSRCRADADRNIDLVCTRKGRPVKTYHEAWYKACNSAGQKMRFYDVRHLAATTMLAAGADIVSVAAQLGHSNCAITGQVYAHALASGQQRAGQALTF